MISRANRALLERKFGRALPAGDPKVTLTVSGIARLLDEARAEGFKTRLNTDSERTFENLEAVLDKCNAMLRGRS